VICPHCQNTMGFVFGTCIECGFNHLDNRFCWVKVWLDDVNIPHWAIARHAEGARRAPAEPQLRDNEPNKSGRHCPLDGGGDD
jgi:hypothetical protein